MHITIEIDDGQERSRLTLSGATSGTPSSPATAAPGDTVASEAHDAGPAPDIFAADSGAPPGATDLSAGSITEGDSVVSAGTAPDLP